MPNDVSPELLDTLRKATRVNMPHVAGYRVVGFQLPDEIAWPEHGTAHDILLALLNLVTRSAAPVTEEMVDAGEQAYDAEPEGWGAHRRALRRVYLAMQSVAGK